MKPTIYTMQTAKVKDEAYSKIRHQSQAEIDFILDDLVAVGPVDCSEYTNTANMLLTFDRVHNNKLNVHFPFYAVAHESRAKLIADWKDFLATRDTLQPPIPNTVGMSPIDVEQFSKILANHLNDLSINYSFQKEG